MNVNRLFSSYGTLAVLTTCLLSASVTQAQTYVGQQTLTESPSHLEAAVYPLSNQRSTIKVIFNNLTGGSVRVVIRDEKKKVVYEEYETTARYRRNFNLSELPEGKYMVELSKQKEQYSQAFSIGMPATMSNIALLNPPVQNSPDKPVVGRLIVSQ